VSTQEPDGATYDQATYDQATYDEQVAGLAEVHVLVRRLLAELDRVAGEVGMPYFLAYGTLLGAARSGDLIPWDVDADVWVHHDHAATMRRELPARLGSDFELLTAETHADYEYLFPRLVLRGIHHVHVRVDLFPLDPAPRTRAVRRIYPRLMHALDRVHFVKRADTGIRLHYSPGKALLTRLLRLAVAPLPASVLQRFFRWLQGRGRRDVLVNSCGSYGEREVVDAAWFARTERMTLGDLSLPVPAGHDALLTQLYGDYRTPVSPEQQRRELAAATTSFVEPLRAAGHLPARPAGQGEPS
jgi:lipopolysaccharide cholinephosphotransferase